MPVTQVLSINTEIKWLLKVLCKGLGQSEPAGGDTTVPCCLCLSGRYLHRWDRFWAPEHANTPVSVIQRWQQVTALPCSDELSWNSMMAVSARSSSEHETRWYVTLNRIQGRGPVLSSGSDVGGCLLTILHLLQSSCRTFPDMPLLWRFCSREFCIVSTGNKSRVYHSSWFFRDSPGVPTTLIWPPKSPSFSKRLKDLV
jgi:hypothetical protein